MTTRKRQLDQSQRANQYHYNKPPEGGGGEEDKLTSKYVMHAPATEQGSAPWNYAWARYQWSLQSRQDWVNRSARSIHRRSKRRVTSCGRYCLRGCQGYASRARQRCLWSARRARVSATSPAATTDSERRTQTWGSRGRRRESPASCVSSVDRRFCPASPWSTGAACGTCKSPPEDRRRTPIQSE